MIEANLNNTASDGSDISIFILAAIALFILIRFSYWKIYKKAGKPGWAAFIPVYSSIVFLQIVGRPIWWIAWMIIPFVNIIISITIIIDLVKSFGKNIGFAVATYFLRFLFLPILAFGKSEYIGQGSLK